MLKLFLQTFQRIANHQKLLRQVGDVALELWQVVDLGRDGGIDSTLFFARCVMAGVEHLYVHNPGDAVMFVAGDGVVDMAIVFAGKRDSITIPTAFLPFVRDALVDFTSPQKPSGESAVPTVHLGCPFVRE